MARTTLTLWGRRMTSAEAFGLYGQRIRFTGEQTGEL